jgi:hypothetical protein
MAGIMATLPSQHHWRCNTAVLSRRCARRFPATLAATPPGRSVSRSTCWRAFLKTEEEHA